MNDRQDIPLRVMDDSHKTLRRVVDGSQMTLQESMVDDSQEISQQIVEICQRILHQGMVDDDEMLRILYGPYSLSA